jgi:hypothetical protein
VACSSSGIDSDSCGLQPAVCCRSASVGCDSIASALFPIRTVRFIYRFIPPVRPQPRVDASKHHNPCSPWHNLSKTLSLKLCKNPVLLYPDLRAGAAVFCVYRQLAREVSKLVFHLKPRLDSQACQSRQQIFDVPQRPGHDCQVIIEQILYDLAECNN